MPRQMPEILVVNEDKSIGEWLTENCIRILLEPSKCYLNDDIVCLEDVIIEIAKRYNEHDVFLAYTGYVDACNKVGKRPKHYKDFRKMPVFENNISDACLAICKCPSEALEKQQELVSRHIRKHIDE